MAYVLTENGIVTQKQPNQQDGFIEAPDNVVCGMLYNAETGEFSAPPAPAPQVPQAVPALEALLALDAAGLSAEYETWANDPARTFAERAFINKALTWRRDDPVLNSAGDALGLTEEQKDQLFIAADQLLTTA
mgnify:FL=1|tara:strand:+ start:3892 stop:4290 length:399 start_codon:yes stop_codon:yes gene_type:complete